MRADPRVSPCAERTKSRSRTSVAAASIGLWPRPLAKYRSAARGAARSWRTIVPAVAADNVSSAAARGPHQLKLSTTTMRSQLSFLQVLLSGHAGRSCGTGGCRRICKRRCQTTHQFEIRRLVELGLTVGAKPKQAPLARSARAKELASKAIDSLTAGAANNDEKASRKRRLIKGPEEFREVRVDRPKGK